MKRRISEWHSSVRPLAADPGFLPTAAEQSRLRGMLRLELVLLAAIFALAAAMARHGGF